MTKQTFFVTSDGKQHITESTALKYAENRYTSAVCSLTALMLNTTDGKYQKVKTFIDENLAMFEALRTLKNDFEIPAKDED